MQYPSSLKNLFLILQLRVFRENFVRTLNDKFIIKHQSIIK